MTLLDSLKRHSIVVADSADIEGIARNKPQDATTNPSLLLKAGKLPQYAHLVGSAVESARRAGGPAGDQSQAFMDELSVAFGCEILRSIPGRVSTEVDARLSFDTDATIAKARQLIEMYSQRSVSRDRILIKIASTWEGIRAAEFLEREGIHCNLTLLFSFAQALACAQAKVTLISPFVGRIYDWYKERAKADIPVADDPGVASVRRIYNYFKRFGYATQIMGASFRKTDQILALAGCDLLTISPDLLEKLHSAEGDVSAVLSPDAARASKDDFVNLDQKTFRWMHNQDAMAVEKLSEGIRNFYSDARKLQEYALTQVADLAVSR